MLERGLSEEDVRRATYANALTAYAQSAQMKEEDWLNPDPIDQRNLFEGNSVLRGGQDPVIEREPATKRGMDELIIE